MDFHTITEELKKALSTETSKELREKTKEVAFKQANKSLQLTINYLLSVMEDAQVQQVYEVLSKRFPQK